MKIIVAPTYEIALYWVKQMEIDKTCRIVTYSSPSHRLRPTKENTIFIEGKKFDYHERKIRQTTWDQYQEIRYRVQDLINRHELNKEYELKKESWLEKASRNLVETENEIIRKQIIRDMEKDYDSQPNFIVAAGVLVGIAIAIGTIIALSYAYFK